MGIAQDYIRISATIQLHDAEPIRPTDGCTDGALMLDDARHCWGAIRHKKRQLPRDMCPRIEPMSGVWVVGRLQSRIYQRLSGYLLKLIRYRRQVKLCHMWTCLPLFGLEANNVNTTYHVHVFQ